MATNPVFLNDMRRSIFRRRPILAALLAAFATLALTYLTSYFQVSSGRGTQEQALTRFPDLLLPVIAPMFTAGAFAKEHELHTWQDLFLSRLSNAQIVAGKFFAGLIPTCVTLLVLAPAFLLVLILQSTWWAMDAGAWMLVLAFKFFAVAVFYLSVGLVCSFHSPNARVALVVSYAVLAVYGILNYTAWTCVIVPELRPLIMTSDGYDMLDMSGSSRWGRDPHSFSLGALDVTYMAQAVALAIGLLLYLLVSLRSRNT